MNKNKKIQSMDDSIFTKSKEELREEYKNVDALSCTNAKKVNYQDMAKNIAYSYDAKDVNGTPFALLACETEELDTAALRKLIPDIV